jgi:site-specific recombinase XerD
VDRLSDLLPSWERSLRARNRAPRTIASYLASAHDLKKFLKDPVAGDITQHDIEDHIDDLLTRTSASNAATAYRRLQQLFRWLTDEGELADNPMRRMSPPHVPDKPVPVITEETIRKLLAACEGRGFEDRRDTAIVRLLLDTGVRAAELVGLSVEDVDWGYSVVTVLGKGRRLRSVPFGAKTSEALDRYLRARRQHRYAELPDLWLGSKGALTASGVTQLLERRCARAGVPATGQHRWRHTAAHQWLANGGQEGDLEMLMGWSKSSGMTRRYGRSAAQERARDAHRRLGLGDRY